MSVLTLANSSTRAAAAQIQGFALYVGVAEAQLLAADTTFTQLIHELKTRLREIAPQAASYAALALTPDSAHGANLDLVRLALGEPAAKAATSKETDQAKTGVVVDCARNRVLLDNYPASLTYKEFSLLQFFVLRPGQTVTREDIITHLWTAAEAGPAPNARTIDVLIRRLRAKLGDYQDIIRTVRGAGYRFDAHPEVQIVSAP